MNRGLITILFIMCSILSSAQSSIIQGIVSDENQQSLEFVSVYIKSTAIGTITNEKGQFSLKIP
ncbi:MAG: carboxypeptidase-like regulatory domain-containing protein, partial [Bacteroidales bacterium]|nr:carboxypeptidase-like regulatory domain-containing protein [Bacteroidales bacterium]